MAGLKAMIAACAAIANVLARHRYQRLYDHIARETLARSTSPEQARVLLTTIAATRPDQP
ncbi:MULTISPECIES: hypothetical protein [Streptacidiphilus]|uniref:Uncharacterized protein n=1 Tax=Streptacidiphilus cavernicola TaxID=3342716 RepID=A0ABV6V199_9ACTN|nr:hypothetical protein [Streptacidiphilus jeojiense]